MGLAVSAVNQEGANGINSQFGRAEKTGSNFQSVFKSASQGGVESMDSIFEEAAQRYDISVDLLKAVAKAESNFNPNAVSKAGAIGVMQLMPATARSLGVADPYDARQNIMGGAKYLKENLERFGGNVSFALAAYNAGPGSVQKYGGIPPYKETQNYVKTVTSYLSGSPIYSGKLVQSSGLSGLFGSSYGLTSNELLSLYGAGSSVGSMYGDSGSGSGLGSYGQAGMLGLGSMGMGSYFGTSTSALSMLLGSATVDEGGDTISLNKESFASLIEILRLQMMMNASRSAGSVTI